MTRALSGTAALITGASSGIGAATALSLAIQGASVALVARRKDRLERLAERIRDEGGTASVVAADITERDEAADAVARAVRSFGHLDILVNNAGVMLLGPVEDAPVEEWDRMVALNVQGLLYTTHAALPHLLAAAEGPRRTADIVNVSSVAGRVALKGLGVYNLTKHGIGAFSESLRQEVTGRRVRVSLIEPGTVETELASHIRPEVRGSMKDTFGTASILQADDIAETIGFVVTRPSHVEMNEIVVRPYGAR
ncbi:SDR family NAD(P)-dependent oxidoreductase [Streptomyces olivaceoviridis]